MRSTIHMQLLAMYQPVAKLASNIDSERHPNVLRWAVEYGGYEEPYNYRSLGWLNGYTKFGDVFEKAARLVPNNPSSALADPWNIVGMRENDMSDTTRRYFALLATGNPQALPLCIATFARLGNAPSNLLEQNQWATGTISSLRTITRPLHSYAEAILGKMAQSWEPDNIDELMAYKVRHFEVKKLVTELYPDTNFDYPSSTESVPFEIVRAGLIDKTPAEYLKAML